MPAAARQSERRPSAPIARRADTAPPPRARRSTSVVADRDRLRRRPRSTSSAGSCAARALRARRADGGSRCCSRRHRARSRSASKRTSGARISRAVSSTMRITRSGAACSRQRAQTPSVSSAVTEPASSAVVRLSAAARGWRSARSRRRRRASAIAAVRPAGPPPTTTTSAVIAVHDGLAASLGCQHGRRHDNGGREDRIMAREVKPSATDSRAHSCRPLDLRPRLRGPHLHRRRRGARARRADLRRCAATGPRCSSASASR